MLNNVFSADAWQEALKVLQNEIPIAIWETIYSTFLATFFSILIGLPLGVILVTGRKGGLHPLPHWLMSTIGLIINILRSIPFLLLVIIALPLTRAIVGTSVGTVASIVPLVIAAFPFVARLVESSLNEIDPKVIEMSQSFGATPFQTVVKVMLPESVPSLISNMTIALATILGYTAMSGILGGGGLGKIAINYGYYRYKYLIMLFAVIFLIILVQVLQAFGSFIARKVDKRIKPKA